MVKRITCLFLLHGEIIPASALVDSLDTDGIAKSIQGMIDKNDTNLYHLFFVMDGNNKTYVAEYAHSLLDFQSRKDLVNGN